MSLSKATAVQIIGELSALLPSQIDIMDTNGVILASSDTERVGSTREDVRRIAEENLEELRYDEGVGCPILFQEKIVGILGIAGEYDEIKHSARMIQRMTELLLRDAYYAEQYLLGETIRSRYLMEWLEAQPHEIDNAFIRKGLALHIDITVPRRVLAAHIRHGNGEEAAAEYLQSYLAKLDRDSICLKQTDSLVCMVSDRDDEETKALAEDMVQRVKKRFGLEMFVGIDEQEGDFRQAGKSFRKALRALNSYAADPGARVRTYDSLSVELFTEEVSASVKKEYILKIMGDGGEKEREENLLLLEVFYRCGGSLKLASEALFIHKNTLQYRLRRIAEHTGYDPRSLRCAGLFQMAIVFYRELRSPLED